jgi:hypothetical protein
MKRDQIPMDKELLESVFASFHELMDTYMLDNAERSYVAALIASSFSHDALIKHRSESITIN